MRHFDWKVFNVKREMIAATAEAIDAAIILAVYGEGKVKVDDRIVWDEVREQFSAAESYDRAAQIMEQRRHAFNVERYARREADRIAAQARYQAAHA